MSDENLSELGIVHRYSDNPILEKIAHLEWANIKVYNPAVVRHENGSVEMVFRAIGKDWVSRLGYAYSDDGTLFEVLDTPVFEGREEYESHGVEDPRITKIGEQYLMLYTAYNGKCARLALAFSTDLKQWERIGLVLPEWKLGFWQRISNGVNNWSKAGALFSRMINGKYVMLFGDDALWLAYSDDLRVWTPMQTPVIDKRAGMFDGGYLEMGAPPLETDRGWVVFYHGVQRTDDVPGDARIYRLGAMLLDRNDPTVVLWRSTFPLLEPLGEEQIGIVDALQYGGGYDELKDLSEDGVRSLLLQGTTPLALFCCGAVYDGSTFCIYYSSMDTAINIATCTLDEILQH